MRRPALHALRAKAYRLITPAAPVLKQEPPVGPQWIHEVKFDGWRMQLHKAGDRVVVFSRNGVLPALPRGSDVGAGPTLGSSGDTTLSAFG